LGKKKMLAPVRISFFTDIFSFKMLTSSAWPITLNPPNTLHKVTGVLMSDCRNHESHQTSEFYFIFCGKKTANSSTLATYNRGLGLQFAKGKKGLIKTHRPHTKSQKRVWDKMNFPVLFIFHWILFFSENWAWVLTHGKNMKKKRKIFYFILLIN
jgi:hypothetical protein